MADGRTAPTHRALEQARSAGSLDELLVDPEFLVRADPYILLPVLHRAGSPAARSAAAVYRASAHRHVGADPVTRRQLLGVDAARLGDHALAAGLARELPWRVVWSTGSEMDTRLLASLPGTVVARALTTSVPKVFTRVEGCLTALLGERDGTLIAVDLATGQAVGDPMPGHGARLDGLAQVRADGRTVVVATGGGAVRLWDLETRRPLTVPRGPREPRGEIVGLTRALPDGRPLLMTWDGRLLHLSDPVTGEPVGRPLPHTRRVDAVVPESDGRSPALAVSVADGRVRTWDLATGRPRRTLTHRGLPILAGHPEHAKDHIAVLHGRPVLVTGGSDPDRYGNGGGRLQIRSLLTGELLGAPVGSDDPRSDSRFPLPSGRRTMPNDVDTAMLDGRPLALVVKWQNDCCPSADRIQVWDLASRSLYAPPLRGCPDRVSTRFSTIAAVDDGTVLVAVRCIGPRQGLEPDYTREDLVKIWALGPEQAPRHLDGGHSGPVRAVAATVTAGRPALLTGGSDGAARLWDPESSRPTGMRLSGHRSAVRAVASVPVGERRLAATADSDGTVCLWDEATGRFEGRLPEHHSGSVQALAHAEVGGLPVLLTGGRDGVVRLWDPAARRPLGELSDSPGRVIHALGTAMVGGRPVALAGGTDGALRLWHLDTGHPLGVALRGHRGPLSTVATTVLSGVPVCVTAGQDGTVRLWDLDRRRALGRPLTAPAARPLRALAATVTDGRAVAAAGADDGTVVVWDLASRTPLGPPLPGHSDAVLACTFITRDTLLTAGRDGTLRLWSPETYTARPDAPDRPRPEHTERVMGLATAVGPAGRPVLVSDSGGEYCGNAHSLHVRHVQDLATGHPIGEPVPSYEGPTTTAAITPAEPMPAYTAVLDGSPVSFSFHGSDTVRARDAATGRDIAPPLCLPLTVNSLTTTDDGHLAIAFGREVAVLEWQGSPHHRQQQ
ncbi:hypothetical protein GCM10027073_21530 [Streptomyces chlorus]|uniref:WD40 repeat domain-containing protein n=1 Tax=Streptomyces chlorus TaxID=887452 RepID=A0ABW1E682_9ACTN